MAQSKVVGIVLLVVAVICAFVAWERWDANAEAVRQTNGLFGGLAKALNNGKEVEAALPAASKYAIFFCLLSTVGGVVLLTRRNARA